MIHFSDEFEMGDSIVSFEDSFHKHKLEENFENEIITWKVREMRVCQVMGCKNMERVLHLQLNDNKFGETNATCHLRDDWYRMEVDVDDDVFVSGNLFF